MSQSIDYAPKFIQKFPVFFRWILFLPAGLLVSSVVAIVNRWTISSYLGADPKSFFIDAWISYISSVALVYVCAVVSPKKQFLVSLIVAIVWCMYGAGTVVFLALYDRLTWQYVVYMILNVIGASMVPYAFHLMANEKQTDER